jgi:hypothetical protein
LFIFFTQSLQRCKNLTNCSPCIFG